MKIVYLIFMLLPLFSFSQEVSTLATVTANGGISLDEEGNIYVAHFGPLPPNPNIGKNIYKITQDGVVSLFVDGELNVGSGNSFDSQGFLYQSNFASNTIYKIDPTGQVIAANYASVAGPVGITAGSNDTLYICSCNSNSIKKLSPDGVLFDFVSNSSFNCPNGITIDENGNLYTTNFSDGRIIKITPQGDIQILGSTPVGNGHLSYRISDKKLYIASYSGHQIFKMDLSGKVELFAGTGSVGNKDSVDPLQATFSKPNGIEISPDGCNLYISQDGNVVRKIKFADSECISSIQNLDKNPSFKIYPNPTSGKVVLKNPNNIEISSIVVFDVQGKQVGNIIAAHKMEFDLSTLLPGTYTFMVVEKSGAKYYKKIHYTR